MITRGFLINLGITVLASTLIFLYFRHRFKQVEHKVNTIFQLVQNHTQNPSAPTPSVVPSPPAIQFEEKNELITVSDDELDSDSESETDTDSDSGEETDTENTGKRRLSPENIFMGLGEIKQVTLTPDPPVENKDQKASVVVSDEATDDLDDVGSLSSNSETDGIINIIKVSEQNKEPEDEEPEDEEPQPVQEMPDYSKLTVPVLKEIATQKGFTNVRKLRKRALVELLSN